MQLQMRRGGGEIITLITGKSRRDHTLNLHLRERKREIERDERERERERAIETEPDRRDKRLGDKQRDRHRYICM